MSDRLSMLQGLLSEDPNDSFVKFAIAKEYEKKGDWSTAITKYNQLTQDDPEYVGTYYHLAKAHEEVEDFDQAIDIYKSGIVVAKKQGDFHALSELNSAKTNLEMEM